ncbi:transmembrane protein 141 isoform X5 [Strix aluco]|uniref:transmembrane protein 141 isoform X5 n=1 Tax=Strix aluco TaxID=111821 RepID=UPI003DA64943
MFPVSEQRQSLSLATGGSPCAEQMGGGGPREEAGFGGSEHHLNVFALRRENGEQAVEQLKAAWLRGMGRLSQARCTGSSAGAGEGVEERGGARGSFQMGWRNRDGPRAAAGGWTRAVGPLSCQRLHERMAKSAGCSPALPGTRPWGRGSQLVLV